MDPKTPGWKTTEGLVTIALTVVSLLAGVGVLTLSQAGEWTEVVKQVGAVLALAIPTAASVWKLIQSRTEVKVAALRHETERVMLQRANMEAEAASLRATLPRE